MKSIQRELSCSIWTDRKIDTNYRINCRFSQACERAENTLAYSTGCSFKQNLPVGSSELCVAAYFIVERNCRFPAMTSDTSEMHVVCVPFLHTVLLWLRWFGSPLAVKFCFHWNFFRLLKHFKQGNRTACLKNLIRQYLVSYMLLHFQCSLVRL